MDTVKQIELIETTLKRAGDGLTSDSPIRIVTQYWTKDGKLVFECDPTMRSVTPEILADIREAININVGENDRAQKIYNAVYAMMPRD
jgi:hypothetical protein